MFRFRGYIKNVDFCTGGITGLTGFGGGGTNDDFCAGGITGLTGLGGGAELTGGR